MKKILSTVAALGLVAGVASTASALEFSVSGHYFVEGVHLSAGDGTGLVLDDDDISNDSYWLHEFKIKPVMKVNDKITVKSTIYLAEHEWGSQADLDVSDGGEIKVHHIYMEYMSPVGKVRVGRTSAGLWQGDFLSTDGYANRLMYFPNFMPENVGACLFLQKSTEADGYTDSADADSDVYEAAVWYKTKDMIAALGYDYYRDARTEGTAAYTIDGFVAGTYTEDGVTVAAVDGNTATKHKIKGYYNQNFSKMYAEVEFAYETGEIEYDAAGTPDDDRETLGVMADVGMNMDKLDVGMMFIYGSGDDDASDNDVENLGALGEQFQPYNILTGRHTGMMVSDVETAMGAMTTAGIISLGVHADFAVSDALSLNAALAYAQAESELKTDASGNAVNWDDEYGWEIDLGISYNLMDNLTYQVDFGYLVAGDFFEEGVAGADAEDVYTLTHKLTMEF